jgi:hypothetical protein
MALNLLIRYRIITNRNATVLAGDYINVYWDDVASVIEVQQFDDAADTSGTVITTGPDLGADRIDYEPVTSLPIPYSYCASTTLVKFQQRTLFPYVNEIQTPNHFSCIALVCDLQISDDYVIQPASDFVTPDGAVEVTATSSNGDIKYSLDPNFDYYTEGETTGLFAGLFAGEYTITVKDELGCVDQITLNVPVPDFYNPLYRLEYIDHNSLPTRVDILERGYSGVITEVCGDADPFILKYNGAGDINKFTAILPSEARLTIMSETNFQFRDLFSEDERKYQIRYYKNVGSATPGFTPAALSTLENWQGVLNGDFDWDLGITQPTVTFTGSDPSSESSLIKASYAFEAGQLYSFAYEFESLTPSVLGVTFVIRILDGTNSTLINKFVNVTSSISGSYSFVAPDGAIGIGVTVFVPMSVTSRTYRINSFSNTTATIPAGDAGPELKWLGYIISSNYSEAYLAPPYPVQVVATDGLADLKTYDYLDKDGNKYRDDQITLTAISEILAKTDLDINILSAINRYEESMSTTDIHDPLNQCKFNPETFYHNNNISSCSEVLEEILKPFGARILQRNGKWCIYSIEEFVTSAPYREFDSAGLLLGNGTIDDVVNIQYPVIQSRAAFRNREQVLAMIPAYGKLFFEHTLLKNASLIKSHSFELDDIFTDTSGITQFKNWNVNISNAPGVTYGIKQTKALEGDYNMFVKYTIGRGGYSGAAGTGDVSVLSAIVPIEYEDVDAFEFRFTHSVLIAPGDFGNLYWIKLKWMLKVGSYYYNENGGWTTDADQKYNEVIIERFNEVLEKKVTALLREVTALTEENAQVEFIVANSVVYDFVDTTALKATPTTTKAIGSKMKVFVSQNIRNHYELREGTDAESLPDVVRPLDYAGTTNERIWVLEQEGVNIRGREVDYVYLDNIVLLHFPDGAEPPNNVTIQRNNNIGIKVNFEESYLLNDIDLENINNSERTYKNYFKKLDGTPTQVWERTYRAGTGKLLDLLSNDVVSQYKRGSNKLTGSFIIDTEVLPTSVMNEVNDGDKKYMFMGYELHDKSSSIGFDLLEVQDTVTDDESTEIDAAFTTGFSLGYRS